MTDNGGGRDSGGGASWFKPSEDRHLKQSDYQDPLEGQEQQQGDTVFPDSGGYAGLSSSRPALADPYPEALGGPPAEPPNPLSYPGAGDAAYRPLTRIPGEDTEPKTQEIPVLRPDSGPLWTDTPGSGGAPSAPGAGDRGGERAPWDADGAATAGDADLRGPAAVDASWDAAGTAGADLRDPVAPGRGSAPWEADPDLDGGRTPAWDADDRGSRGAEEADGLRESAGYPNTAWDSDGRGGTDLGDERAPWGADAPADDPRGPVAPGRGSAPWEADPDLDGGRTPAWEPAGDTDPREPVGYPNTSWEADGRNGGADLRGERAPWDAAAPVDDLRGPAAGREDASWEADAALDGGRTAAWDADGRDGAGLRGERAPWGADAPVEDLRAPAAGREDAPWEADATLDGGRTAAWDADDRSGGADLRGERAPWGADAPVEDLRGPAGREGAPWEADPALDGGRGGAGLRSERAPWDADGDDGLGRPAGYPDTSWDADDRNGGADPLGERGPWDSDSAGVDDDLRGPAAGRGDASWGADPDLDGDRGGAGLREGGSTWDTDLRESAGYPGTSWDADGRSGGADLRGERGPWDGDSAGVDDDLRGPAAGRGDASWEADPDLDGGRTPAWEPDGDTDLRESAGYPNTSWDADDRNGGADPLGERGPWDADADPLGERTSARSGGIDPLTDDSYGSRGADDRGSSWGPQADPLSDDRGTGWDDDPLRDGDAAPGEEDPWGWSRNADGDPGPVRVPDSREERASAPWTDVPEPDAWEGEAPGASGNTWAFDRDDPRLPDVVREAERRRREEAGPEEDPLAAIADMQSRARAEEPEATQMIAPVADAPEEDPEYDDGFTPADYGMPVKPKAKKRKKDPIAEEFPGFEDRPLGGEAGDPYPGYDSVDFLADTERGAVLTMWLGVASLIPGVGLVTALLALLVTGPKAKRAIRASNGQLDGLGLITGGTVFAVIGILVTVISVAVWLLL
ncbi:hypothetical protein ACOQFV_00600 [Nocardiopsis changdeensis]|uniref:DUF4190 domain-containing protein n=1 Tax=Nocardiopsis changdeensis TaxID=2831969 RepID=A0ABX8BJ05_9ACTN|nr:MULTISPECIES: hypothetical protein [Nocardiopsis]QUX22186.1 hypothetical protein KGD84_28185 [Nocardiopsis changdeensis]QYX38126.1 hypothetical protein K1J57_05570 [Nocardiopsis sp. MT53]